MDKDWQRFDAVKTAEKLIQTNEHTISGDAISGFGMKAKVAALVDDIRGALFPNIYGTQALHGDRLVAAASQKLRNAAVLLDCMIAEVLVNRCRLRDKQTEKCGQCRDEARAATVAFMNGLEEIAGVLRTDIEAAYDGDPAAMSREEILLSYPGFEAVTIYRLAHVLYGLGIPLLPRIMTELAHSKFGIDIHPGATIGKYFFIDHGTGVVVGETCTIGDHVKIYQGVTLGAKSFRLDENGNPVKGIKRHPDIGDGVVIYAGATILGGGTKIGAGSVIGGNVWLTESVAPGTTVYNAAPGPIIKNGGGA